MFLGGLYRAERTIAERLLTIAAGKLPWPDIDVEKALPWVERKTGLVLAPGQTDAVRLALTSKATVITGGPGVGKTTIVNSILRILAAKNVDLLLCAPTGRAAKRMSEATGLEARTIHRLLEVDPRTGGFRRGADNPLDCGLLVVDETSMVDVMLMRALLAAVRVTPGTGQLTVAWDPATDADGYKVQWKSGAETFADAATDGREATVASGSTTRHTITGLANGTAYDIQVIATRTNADDGTPSAPASGTPAAASSAPGQVTGVRVTPGTGQLTVAWDPATDADGYKVQWKSGAETFADAATDGREATVASGSTTRHTITGLANGTAYDVQVIATRTNADDGTPSATVSDTPDVQAARITGVAFTNLPPNDTYRLGDTIEVSITFNKAVQVTGSPRVQMYFVDAHSFYEYANYDAASSTNRVLVFKRLVTANDDNESTVRVIPDGLKLKGGTIRNKGTTINAVLDHDMTRPDPSIDTRWIKGIAVTSDPAVPETVTGNPVYGPDEKIQFKVTFKNEVDVDQTGGAPKLKFRSGSGSSTYAAAYESGTGTKDLVFAWTVPANISDDGAGLVVRANHHGHHGHGPHTTDGLVLDGGTIESRGGFVVNIRHGQYDTDSRVDATAPVLAAGADGATADGTALVLTFQNPDAGNSPDHLDEASVPAPADFAVAVAGAARTVSSVNINGAAVTLTLASPLGHAETVMVGYTPGTSKIRDRWGNEAAQIADRSVRNDSLRLTATLEDVPSNHDGSNTFTFRIAFSAEVMISPQDMKDHALTVTGGTVTNAARVDGRKDLWELTAEPAGTGPVSILVPPDRACTETGALCTADGRALSTELGQSVPGPAMPLAASFVSVPAEHDGETAFWLELSFDAAVVQDSKTHIRALLGVTGGSETRMRRKDNRLDHWRIRIQPSSHEVVTVTLSPSPACGATGAVCTEDGRTYTTALATQIQGLPGLAVADAEVQEAANATLAFAVTLSRAPLSTVTVGYATSDGTAAAGSDYTATSGSLTFAAGETEKTVSVPVLDDGHDEGSETLTLTLSNPSGGYVADGTATGTITNTGAMPEAWIARFGRTVTDQVLDAVDARLRAARTAGMSVSLGGETIGGTAAEADGNSGAVSDGKPASLFGGTAAVDAEDTARLKALSDWLSQGTEENDRSNGWSRTLTERELLLGSSFSVVAQTGGGGFAGLWGQMAQTSFAGREDSLSLDGDVTTGLLGADYASGRWTTGLVISNSVGEGGYRGAVPATAPVGTSGDIEATVTALTPWAGYAVTDRLSVWGAAGYGAGALTLTPEDDPALKADLEMMLAAAGARGTLVGGNGPKLDMVGDVRLVRTTTASVSSSAEAGGRLESASAEVTRVRLGLEGSWLLALGDEAPGKGATVTPRVALGVRHDGGDAETGFGADIGGGVALAVPAQGLTISLEGRGVLTHEAAGLRDRGVAGTLAWDPLPSTGRGPKLTLQQTIGAGASGGKDALLSRTTLEGLAANDNGDGQRRLEARFGYGVGVFGDRFTMTPEMGLGLSEVGRDYSLGWQLTRSGSGPGSLELSLEVLRRESANDNISPEHGIGFGLDVRF